MANSCKRTINDDNVNNTSGSGRKQIVVGVVGEVKNAYDFYSYSRDNPLNSVHLKLMNTILYYTTYPSVEETWYN